MTQKSFPVPHHVRSLFNIYFICMCWPIQSFSVCQHPEMRKALKITFIYASLFSFLSFLFLLFCSTFSGDIIIKEGTIGSKMYFIQEGIVDIVMANGEVGMTKKLLWHSYPLSIHGNSDDDDLSFLFPSRLLLLYQMALILVKFVY